MYEQIWRKLDMNIVLERSEVLYDDDNGFRIHTNPDDLFNENHLLAVSYKGMSALSFEKDTKMLILNKDAVINELKVMDEFNG